MYIKELYIDKNNIPIKVEDRTAIDVIRNAQEVLARVKRGTKGLIFTNVSYIYKSLVEQLAIEKENLAIPITKPLSLVDRVAAIEAAQQGKDTQIPIKFSNRDLSK